MARRCGHLKFGLGQGEDECCGSVEVHRAAALFRSVHEVGVQRLGSIAQQFFLPAYLLRVQWVSSVPSFCVR